MHCLLKRVSGAGREANLRAAHFARTRAQLRRLRSNMRQKRSATLTAHATRPCARVGGCVLCVRIRIAHVFHACSIVTFHADSGASGDCVVANRSCFRVFARAVCRRAFRCNTAKNNVFTQPWHVLSPAS